MKVQGTQPTVKPIEVNVDTVYVRSNIVRIETEDFVGWEYDEEQYGKDEFIEKISREKDDLNESVILLEEENLRLNLSMAQSSAETVQLMALLNEQQKLEQAKANAELIQLIFSMTGGTD